MKELRRPHLVLSDVGDKNRCLGNQGIEDLQHILRLKPIVNRYPERAVHFELLHTRNPQRRLARSDRLTKRRQHRFRIAFEKPVYRDHFIAFRQIDIDLDFVRIRAEFRRVADDAVVPPGTDIEDAVTFPHGTVRVGGTMHAEHPETERMVLREDAFPEQCGDHRYLHPLGEHPDLVPRTSDKGAVAGENDRPLRITQFFRHRFDCFPVIELRQPVAGQPDRYRKIGREERG